MGGTFLAIGHRPRDIPISHLSLSATVFRTRTQRSGTRTRLTEQPAPSALMAVRQFRINVSGRVSILVSSTSTG